MSAYTCTKVATFAGKKYVPGDTVPAEAIPADRVGAVIRMGLVVEQCHTSEPELQKSTEPAPIIVPVTSDGGVLEIELTPEEVVSAVCILQMTAEEATRAIGKVESPNELVLIHACDSRKTVKAAAKSRAVSLDTPEGESGASDVQDAQSGIQEGENGASSAQNAQSGTPEGESGKEAE